MSKLLSVYWLRHVYAVHEFNEKQYTHRVNDLSLLIQWKWLGRGKKCRDFLVFIAITWSWINLSALLLVWRWNDGETLFSFWVATSSNGVMVFVPNTIYLNKWESKDSFSNAQRIYLLAEANFITLNLKFQLSCEDIIFIFREKKTMNLYGNRYQNGLYYFVFC